MSKLLEGAVRLPDFYVVGAQKCGTTSLHAYLNSHPSICLPAGKETKYFVRDDRYQLGLDHYLGQWHERPTENQLIGEVDPDYMYFEVALERMASVLNMKKTKFIFVFREPVARAFSQYLMTYRRGVEELDFEEAVVAEPERIKRGFRERSQYSYLDRGYYYRQVLRFLEKVDSDNVFYILSEDLSDNTESVMNDVFAFLGLDATVDTQSLKHEHRGTMPKNTRLLRAIVSQGAHKELVRMMLPFPNWRKKIRQKIIDWNETEDISIKLRDDTSAELKKRFLEENDKLSALIGRDLGHWA